MKLTKEMLIDWIDRPPSNSDLDFINKIIELEKRVEQYENPDDLTLFYMWLDVRAKDKMKQMETEILKLKQQNSMITKISEQLEKRIYKARKMIFDNYGVLDKYEVEMLDDILKGDSE